MKYLQFSKLFRNRDIPLFIYNERVKGRLYNEIINQSKTVEKTYFLNQGDLAIYFLNIKNAIKTTNL